MFLYLTLLHEKNHEAEFLYRLSNLHYKLTLTHADYQSKTLLEIRGV